MAVAKHVSVEICQLTGTDDLGLRRVHWPLSTTRCITRNSRLHNSIRSRITACSTARPPAADTAHLTYKLLSRLLTKAAVAVSWDGGNGVSGP